MTFSIDIPFLQGLVFGVALLTVGYVGGVAHCWFVMSGKKGGRISG